MWLALVLSNDHPYTRSLGLGEEPSSPRRSCISATVACLTSLPSPRSPSHQCNGMIKQWYNWYNEPRCERCERCALLARRASTRGPPAHQRKRGIPARHGALLTFDDPTSFLTREGLVYLLVTPRIVRHLSCDSRSRGKIVFVRGFLTKRSTLPTVEALR